MKEKDPSVTSELDKLLAQISPKLIEKGGQVFGKFPPIIQQALQVQQQYAPPAQDPALAVAQIQKQIEDNKVAAKKEETTVKEQGATQREQLKQQAKSQETKQKAITDKEIAEFKEKHADARNMTDNQVRERMNQQDNLTAMTIAAAEIENNENTALQTGGGINPGE
jgi:hypothetical protein